MSDSNNNTTRTNDSSDPKAKLNEEARIFKSFSDIFRERFASAKNENRLTNAYGGPDAEDFAGERNIIRNFNSLGMGWGLGAGILSFAILRRAPKAMAQFMYNRTRNAGNGSSSGGYKFDKVEGGAAMPRNNPFHKPGVDDTTALPKFGIVFRTLGLCVDMFLSVWAAAATSFYFTDGEEIGKSLGSIPLVEGRSILAEEMCDDFIMNYQSIPKEFWLKTHKNPGLNYIEMFVKNCQKRQIYEKELRKDMGLDTHDPVLIPPPGVPSDLYVPEQGTEQNNDENHLDSFNSFEENHTTMSDDSFDDGRGTEQWTSFDDKKEETKERKPRWGF